jgi:hypothetical protein
VGPDGKLLNDPSAAGQAELADLKDSLTDTQPAGALVCLGLLRFLLHTTVEIGSCCCWVAIGVIFW